jgi:hypothetical protein
MPLSPNDNRSPIRSSKLLSIVCGNLRSFSYERQMLNFVLIFSALAAVTNASENALLGIPGSAIMVVQAAIYLAGYGLVRVIQAPIQPVTAVMLLNFLLISSFAWFEQRRSGWLDPVLFYHASNHLHRHPAWLTSTVLPLPGVGGYACPLFTPDLSAGADHALSIVTGEISRHPVQLRSDHDLHPRLHNYLAVQFGPTPQAG